jgi:hypothetical protein
MDREIVKRAMELSANGLRVAQIAKQLGVNCKVLRKEISLYNEGNDNETQNVAVIVNGGREELGKTAHDVLYGVFEAIKGKINDPFVSIGELSSAASTCYKIYSAEIATRDENGNDDNNPLNRLFGDELM